MDHELKQRLIGAVVITALAAIFIPMLFDDPVDNSAKNVAEMTAPPAPVNKTAEPDNLPANKAQVLNSAEPELKVSEFDENQTGAGNVGQNVSPVDKNLIEKPSPVPNAGSDIAENPLAEQSAVQNQANETSGLDTGDVIPPDEAEDDNVIVEPKVKKPAPDNETAKTKIKSDKSTTEKSKTKKVAATEKTKAAVDKQAKETTAKPGSKLVRWSLQAGSYSKKENAQAALDKLRKQGFPATMVNKGNLYRIKIGPELDKNKAMEMKSKLAAQKIQSYLQTE